MIKIIIKEQATRAGTAAAGSQAIKSYYNPNQTKTKAKTKEATSVTDTESSQPQQEPEETKPKGIVPSNWKPEIGTEIQLKGVKYKANAIGGWLPNGIGLPIPKTSPIFSTLNTLAYNEEQKKKVQSTSTTVPLDPQEAPTEEASTPVTVQEVSDEINYEDLYEKIYSYDPGKLGDIAPFTDTIINYLLENSKLFTDSYNQIKQGIAKEAIEIFKQYKFIKDVERASKTIAGLFMEDRKKQQIVEIIDPYTGLLLLLIGGLGGLAGLKIAKKIDDKAQYEESQNTPEGQYLTKLNLLLSVKFISHFIDSQSDVQSYMSEVTSDITKYMEQFKSSKFKFFGFTQTKLFKQIDEELKKEANNLLIKIAGLSDKSSKSDSDTVAESTIKRWKLLAGIRG
jgi:hypothetical protein